MKELIGTGTALITPFTKEGLVDFPAIEKLIEQQIAGGTDYFVMLGTTGETATLNDTEKNDVVAAIRQANAGRKPLVLGVGGNNTAALLMEIKNKNLKDICAILSVSPYYSKPNQEGIYLHYKALAHASPLPIILYNVPGRTGSNISAETQLRLAKEKNIVATKEASGNMEQVMQIIALKPKDFLVISGDDALTFPMMACGASGVISVINHAFPKTFSGMVRDCLNSHWDKAREKHYKVLESAIAIFGDGSPGGIKVMLNELGICQNVLRLPLAPVNAALETRLRALANKAK